LLQVNLTGDKINGSIIVTNYAKKPEEKTSQLIWTPKKMSALNSIERKVSSPANALPLVSIIITNYNYEKFLPRAIESALQQTYPMKEIIVVDDGSTDNSPHIINSYGNQITPVFQENRERVAATNTGFFASRGEIIFFLDADDCFFPHKVETMVNYYLLVLTQTPDALIFHRLEIRIDGGVPSSIYTPSRFQTLDGKKKKGPFEKLSDPATAYQHIRKWGFLPFITSPTSGLSLTRSLASRVFPLPEDRCLIQDRLLVYSSMLFGTVYGSSQVLGCYILHGDNDFLNKSIFGSNNDCIRVTVNFINDILQKINRNRIASFYDSGDAKSYYKNSGSIKGLLKLAYKVPARCFHWETIGFSIKTLWLCLKIVLGIKKGPQHSKTWELFEQAKKIQSKQDYHHSTSF